jgi:hypothetical protein
MVCSALIASACELTGPAGQWESRRALISTAMGDLREVPEQMRRFAIVVPDTVPAGIPARIIVSSFGSGSCTRRAGAETTEQPGMVRIAPWVRVRPAGTICTSDLSVFPETVAVRPTVAGPLTVRLVGLAGSSRAPRLDSLERTIIVR